ncbi:MAG: hypothetical protein HKL85_13215 [Acidimicrobiaceae bacterium]|nr:hypothetical protein [Acidimicrobiaceae bacterium]
MANEWRRRVEEVNHPVYSGVSDYPVGGFKEMFDGTGEGTTKEPSSVFNITESAISTVPVRTRLATDVAPDVEPSQSGYGEK